MIKYNNNIKRRKIGYSLFYLIFQGKSKLLLYKNKNITSLFFV